jgi:hypothetical protein
MKHVETILVAVCTHDSILSASLVSFQITPGHVISLGPP